MTPQEQQELFVSKLRIGRGFIGWKAPFGGYQQKAFETIAEALALIAAHRDEANIWCAMAEFSPGTSRDAINAASLQSFWFDVDAHGKGPYETPDDALAGIRAFVKAAALPKPNYINMTGHGTQVFWTLEEAVAKADWQPVADDLQELAKCMNLGADPITADPARILRVPGTYNFRDPDNPVATVLREVKACYTDLGSFHATIKAALSKMPPLPPKPNKLMPTCVDDTPRQRARLAEMLSCITADCSYELYRDIVWAILSLGWHDGEEIAHGWCLTAPDRFDDENFWNVANSHDALRTPTMGTIIHFARAGGWNG
jgi:hypothetical protein